MPRIDRTIPPEELEQIRNGFTAVDSRYVRAADRAYRTRINCAEGDERYPTYGYYYGPASADPYGTTRPCRNCRNDYGVPPDGCQRCRPDIWVRCHACASCYLIGRECACMIACEGCGTRMSQYEMIQVEGGERYCDWDCAENAGASQCDDCGEVATRDSSGLCYQCRPCNCGQCRECNDRARIRYYSYKPRPLFKGNGPLYLGMECEISTSGAHESRTEIAAHVQGYLDGERIAYLKSDSSIERGFELVTHPMSYDWAMSEFPWQLFRSLTDDYGCEESNDCGIHVHASRAGFSGVRHTYLWQKFFYRNALQIQRLARRTNSSWARFNRESRDLAAWVAKRGGYRYEEAPASAWYLPRTAREYLRTYTPAREFVAVGPPDRYSAINVQNAATFEVRVFAGSLRPVQIQAALGLVHASIEYTRQLDTQSVLKKSGWTWGAFRDWVSTRDQYGPLNSEIERLGV